jgi:hypothetical protein
MSVEPRSRGQRRRDTEHRLAHDKDVWVASASAEAVDTFGTRCTGICQQDLGRM